MNGPATQGARRGEEIRTGADRPPFDIVERLVASGRLSREQVAYARRVQAKLETPRALIDILKELRFVDGEEIRELIRAPGAAPDLGELLVELGVLPPEDLETARAVQRESRPPRRLAEILIERRMVEERTLIEVLSLQLGYPFVEPDFAEIDPRLFQKMPANAAVAPGFVPLRLENGIPLVAFVDPLDAADLACARELFGPQLIVAIARRGAVERAFRRARLSRQREKVTASDEQGIIALVNRILASAVDRGASDVHIEPFAEHVRVRFREDGVLVPVEDFPASLMGAVTNRLKVMCDVDITEKRRHQGGRFTFEHRGTALDLRASFYVTVHGEKIALRLLNRRGTLIPLEQIGLAPRQLERFREEALNLPSGVILVTGPTGSGKTTTVYSCIRHLNEPQVSILTAEEPVEALIDGICQCSINPRIQLTYEETLRHIVRQDPDVLFIGEVRDAFSAETAVQAALTGHRVLTTFHSEDTIGGLIRLLHLNLEAYLVASTVSALLAQRLVRRVCPHCAVPDRPSAADLRRLGAAPEALVGAAFRRGRGCERCRYSGYQGRVGVFELLVLNEEIRSAVIERRGAQDLRRTALETAGLVTLFEDGLLKAARGMTTLEEVLRCLPRLIRPRPLPELSRLLEA
ncbi:MAG: type II/IV secretion system protein [Desulfobacterales bacterium]